MKILIGFLMAAALVASFGLSTALADSSGSFSADIATTACTLNTSTGALGGNVIGSLTATLQTPNSSQTAIDLRPSFVTGLFTDTKITTTATTSSATAEVRVHVTLDGVAVAPDLPNPAGGTMGVTYDARFQQLSSNLFAQIATCATASPACFIDLVLSTLSAHSMDFVAPSVGGGSHTLLVTTEMDCFVNGASEPCGTVLPAGSAAACEGPGVLTVEQVKNFHNDSTICISPTGSC